MYTIASRAFSSGLPEKIRVGPITYRITLASNPTAPIEGEEVPLYGMVNFRKAEITIADDLQPSLAWQCLLHEAVHIFFEHMGLEEPAEGQIDQMAYMLLGFLLDNGFLVEIDIPALESMFTSGSTAFPDAHTKGKK